MLSYRYGYNHYPINGDSYAQREFLSKAYRRTIFPHQCTKVCDTELNPGVCYYPYYSLHYLYKLGRDLQALDLSFKEFEMWMKDEPTKKEKYHRKHWTAFYGTYTPQQHYVRKSGHQKKTLTEEERQKREWRIRKKWEKAHCGYDRGFSKKYYKKKANGRHRAWERDCIAHERWEELGGNYTKITHDPWDIY